jgi:hypothetical protein
MQAWVALCGVAVVVTVLAVTAYMVQAPAIALIGCGLIAVATLAASWSTVSRRRRGSTP